MDWIMKQFRRLHWRLNKTSSEDREWKRKNPIKSALKDFVIYTMAFFCLFIAYDNWDKVTQLIHGLFAKNSKIEVAASYLQNQNVYLRDMKEYYPNCKIALADGVQNIRKYEKAYRIELDSDNDGIACEPFIE